MWPFVLWAAQVFVFCTTVGLVAFDYRILRKSGFGGRELLTIHRFVALSAYGSTLAAAVGSALIAILANRVGDLTKFLIDAVVGGVK
jgi:hypothetical protein